jgi:hypothetical protein
MTMQKLKANDFLLGVNNFSDYGVEVFINDTNRISCVTIGCRIFGSFEQAFRYEGGKFTFKEWCEHFDHFVGGDGGVTRADLKNRYQKNYSNKHGSDPEMVTESCDRVPEIFQLWIAQQSLLGVVKFKPYYAPWLRKLVKCHIWNF